MGRHLESVLQDDPTQLEAWAKCLFAIELLYLIGDCLPRISVLLLYLRVFTNRWARITCYGLLVTTIAVFLSYTFAVIFNCTPVAFQWDKSIDGGWCYDQEAFYKTTSFPNIMLDVVMLVLPIPMIVKLQAPMIRKLGLGFVFVMGSMSVF